MIRNRQAVAPVGLQPVLFNVQQQRPAAVASAPPAGTGNNRSSGSTVAILACLIIIIITIIICAIVFIFFVNFDDDVSCSPRRFHEIFKLIRFRVLLKKQYVTNKYARLNMVTYLKIS